MFPALSSGLTASFGVANPCAFAGSHVPPEGGSGSSSTRYLSHGCDKPYVGIDWITCKIPVPDDFPEVCGGFITSETQDHEVEWQARKKLAVRGSFSSAVLIRTATGWSGQPRVLEVSGNPSKSLTGHNVWPLPGHNLQALISLWVNLLLAESKLPALVVTEARISRIDLCAMSHVGDQSDAEAVLSALAQQAYVSYRGRGVRKQNTAYWGQGSTHWSLKAYSKFVELSSKLKDHKLPLFLGDDLRERLLSAAAGTIRLEVQMSRQGLVNEGLEWLSAWTAETAYEIWSRKMATVKLSGQVPLAQNLVETLPRHLQATYLKWESGFDFAQHLTGPGRATWYRHRAQLLELAAVDISIPRADAPSPHRVRLQKVVELVPSAPPAWIWDHVQLAA